MTTMTAITTAPKRPAKEDAMRIGNLFALLASAEADLLQAKDDEQNARSRTTAFLNAVNRMQKTIDTELDKQRKQAAGGTDWRTSHR